MNSKPLSRMPFSALLSFVFMIHAIAWPCVVLGENWPQWRGPRRDAVSQEKGLPLRWSRAHNIAWRLPLPGPAGATPVVWNDRIFLTSVEGPDLVLLCVNTEGRRLWKKVVGTGNQNVRHDEGNFASPSPSTDGQHVWACFSNGSLACYDLDGKLAWKVDLQQRYGRFDIMFGMSATPVLDGERLYLQLIHGDGNPRTREAIVVALDKRSGKQIWKHDRTSDAIQECEHSYASPTIYRDKQREFLLTHGADYIVAHRLKDGKELWRCGNMNPKGNYNETLRFVASPLAVPGLIVVPSAKNGPMFGLRPDLQGDVSDKLSAYYWKRPHGTPDVPSPLVHDGLVYLCRENGNLICMDAKTGLQIYQHRTVAGRHRASPVYADGRIYLTARNEGIVSVVQAGRRFKILAQNELGEPISASPVISNGRIYLRSFKALYAIGNRR